MQVLYGFFVFHFVSGFSVPNTTKYNRTNQKRPVLSSAAMSPCGEDKLAGKIVEEGFALIEDFPWLGILVYPIDGDNPSTTAVILISDDVVLSTALDIDYYSKDDFRSQSRVILGNNCTGPYIAIRDYTFHPDFTRSTYSTLALVQLFIEDEKLKLTPICPPPSTFSSNEEVFAMTLINDCYNSSMVKIHKMDYVDETRCRHLYLKIGLDIQSMWPTHLACAQGRSGGHCIWRSGTALVIRHEGQWKLLGVGIYGPGCESSSRFLDYGMYHLWVKRIISKIGQPTISRIANNYVVIRRLESKAGFPRCVILRIITQTPTTTDGNAHRQGSSNAASNIQRFGACDAEETSMEIFSDRATLVAPHDEYDDVHPVITAYYNVTLMANVDYHCIIFQAKKELNIPGTPLIKIRRMCPEKDHSCSTRGRQNLYYYVVLKFKHICTFSVNAYGVYVVRNDTDFNENIEFARIERLD